MNKASELLRFSSPSRIGLIAGSQWLDIEAAGGALPEDYKDILSTLGYGRFGDLRLFHPDVRRDQDNFPRAEEDARKFLILEQSDFLNDFLRDRCRLLGVGPERRYLAYNVNRWWSIAWDIEEIDPLGSNLVEFLILAYESLVSTKPHPLAESIWKRAPDGSRSAFFIPANE